MIIFCQDFIRDVLTLFGCLRLQRNVQRHRGPTKLRNIEERTRQATFLVRIICSWKIQLTIILIILIEMSQIFTVQENCRNNNRKLDLSSYMRSHQLVKECFCLK